MMEALHSVVQEYLECWNIYEFLRLLRQNFEFPTVFPVLLHNLQDLFSFDFFRHVRVGSLRIALQEAYTAATLSEG